MDDTINIEELKAKAEEYLAGWKRAQADYINLKKETEREKSEFSKFANERLLDQILPAVDQFDIALNFAPDTSALPEESRKKLDSWMSGLRAVRTIWEGSFKDIGLVKVPTSIPFDPLIHEAVGEEEAGEQESGSIVRVVQSGWRLNGKLLRPAKVITKR